MTEKEIKFIEFSILGKLSSKELICKEYSIDKINCTIESFFIEKEQINIDDFNLWTEKHQDHINRIRNLVNDDRRKGFGNRYKFLEWYISQEKSCCYCGVKEQNLKEYFTPSNQQYKDARQRGKYLEIERIVTAPKEKNIYSEHNCSLSCYVCNNAKSDFISPKDFKFIAKGINKFWNEVLQNEVKFPEKSLIWSKQ